MKSQTVSPNSALGIRTEYELSTAHDVLLKFSWPTSTITVADEVDEYWPRYELGLSHEKYGRSLNDLEIDYEFARFLRSTAMIKLAENFQRLISAAGDFVGGLGSGNRQMALGQRAVLALANEWNRPSPGILFQPLLPPENPPLALTDYESLSGGRHVFGARLLWWCAAARQPSRFGYSADFTLTLRNQPFWIATGSDRTAKPNREILERIRSAADFVMQVDDISVPANGYSGKPAEEPDGPLTGCRFRWKGVIGEVTSKQSHVLEYLWNRRQQPVPLTDLIDEYWNERTAESTVSSFLSRLNTRLMDEGIGVQVHLRSSYLFLELQ